MTKHEPCPFMDCSGFVVPSAKESWSSCKVCGRMVWICSAPECGAVNRVFSRHCRKCGSGRVPNLPEVKGSTRLEYFEELWAFPVDTETDGQIPGTAPSLLSVGDLLLVSAPSAKTVCALNALTLAIEPQARLVWTTGFGASLEGGASKLFAVGSYAYVLTGSPPYLNRIALDSGRRQILALATPSGLEGELSGGVFPSSAPTLLPTRGVIPDLKPSESALLVLTGDGISLLVLHDDPQRSEVRAIKLRGALRDHRWTTPTVGGGWVVATSVNPARYVAVDVAALDDNVSISTRALTGEYSGFSECTAVTERSSSLPSGAFIWVAQRSTNEEWDLVMFEPPATVKTIGLPGVRRAGHPILDGGRILVPGANDQDVYGLWRVFPQRQGVRDLQPAEFLPYAASGSEAAVDLFPASPGKLIGVGPRQLWVIDTLAPVGGECVCRKSSLYASPDDRARSGVMAGSLVFVCCDRFVRCYKPS